MSSARYQLLEKSIKVSKEHFPLGSGFGTFGSYYSSAHYSILYKKDGVYGLTKDNSAFVSDSF